MMWGLIGGVVTLTVICTWLSSLHLAIRDASRSDLERRLKGKREGESSPHVDWLFDELPRAAAGVSLLRTLARVAVVVLMVMLLDSLFVGAALAAAVLWVFTSVVSTALARYQGDAIIASGLGFVRSVYLVFLPVASVASLIDEIVRRLSGANLRSEDELEEELLRSVEDSQREGGLDEIAAEMIENVVEFATTDVGEVMTPRTDIEGLLVGSDLAEIRAYIVEAGHSRYPVYEESLDEIRGILYVKDLVPFLGEDATGFDLDKVLRQPIRVPETKPVSEMLADFQRAEVHLAIVIDEYGGTAGLVTIEDVLEEIVGEIQDEHDPDDEEAPELIETARGEFELDGRYRIDDVNEALDLALPEDEDYDTIAGFMLAQIGRVPAVGESFEKYGWTFEVMQAEMTHIARVAMRRR